MNRNTDGKINEKLSEILAGILLSGIIIQGLFFIVVYFHRQFRSSEVSFSTGLWIGVATSILLSVHLYRSIDRALEMEQDAAERYMRRVYIIRTVVILLVAGIVWHTKVGYVMAVFLGMLCLKFGSWLQPLVHRIVSQKP
ncbi:MAG: hypothetical protein LIO94_01010 [Clostridiales bacterium]|nr:hypothetical protein [Clostridiales bacterium]